MIQRVEKQRQVTGVVGVIREIAANVTKSNGVGIGDLEQSPTAFLTKNTGRGRKDDRDNKAARYCNYCKKLGYNTDQCFKLTGYPDWYRGVRENVKAKAHLRVAANAVGQEFGDTPLDETPHCKETHSLGQVDTNWVQALAPQEMMKWMKGKESSDSRGPSTSHSATNQSAFAHLEGINPMSSQSGICCL